MKLLPIGMIATLLPLLYTCGSDGEERSVTQDAEASQQGILSNQQQQALEAARSIEQTLLDSAADREDELAVRLRPQ